MMRWTSDIFAFIVALVLLTSCEKPVIEDNANSGNGNVVLRFSADGTRSSIANYFNRLNVQLFDDTGAKVFDKVKTQQSGDSGFGSLSLDLSECEYTVVAVGHSSKISATIKSPQQVTFTASDGEKLTDTFCYCGSVSVSDDSPIAQECPMLRATAMVRFCFNDSEMPETFARMVFDYSGGSANFNPTNLQGITKSQQSESRPSVSSQEYAIYTFPYLSESGTLKITATATTADGSSIRQRIFENVPVTRNRITTYTGTFFEEGDGHMQQSGISFTVNGEWDGEDCYEF